ncbi:rhodanese-like domain-containing protein [Enterococcus alishanensis]
MSLHEAQEISPDELEELLKKDAITLLDVRVVEQYQSGHIKEALNFPLANIANYQGSKDKPIYLVCRTGNKSEQAAEILQAKGYQTFNMTGGMHQWFGEIV